MSHLWFMKYISRVEGDHVFIISNEDENSYVPRDPSN